MTLIFTDRYSALGITPPEPETVCPGQCEGMGFVPLTRGTRALLRLRRHGQAQGAAMTCTTHHAGCECHEARREAELQRLLRIERIAGRVLHEIASARCHCNGWGGPCGCGVRLAEKAEEACAELWPARPPEAPAEDAAKKGGG